MPIYEYRCPEGHTFERFQSMTAPAPEQCDLCGASPVEIVLYPVAIHYKGSGFYSTDYGKSKAAKGDGDSSSSDSSKGDSKSADAKTSESKSSESKSSESKSSDSKPSSSSSS